MTSARRSCSSCTEGRAAYTLALYDTDLEAVRAATGAARVHLIGHSWGGLLALRFAIARPGELASLVLADGIPPTSKTFEAGETRFAGRVEQLSADGVIGKPAADAPGSCVEQIRAILPVYFADPRAPYADDIGAMTCAAGINEATLGQIDDFDLRPELAQLHVPALAIVGEVDPFGTEWARETAAAIPGAKLLVVPKAGYFPWVEQGEAFFAALDELFRGAK